MSARTLPLTKQQVEEFLERLEGPEGCDFREQQPGNPESMTWRCAGGTDQSLARKILTKMGLSYPLIEDVLEFCSEHGGHCDCEILFNAEDDLEAQSR